MDAHATIAVRVWWHGSSYPIRFGDLTPSTPGLYDKSFWRLRNIECLCAVEQAALGSWDLIKEHEEMTPHRELTWKPRIAIDTSITRLYLHDGTGVKNFVVSWVSRGKEELHQSHRQGWCQVPFIVVMSLES